MNFKLKTDNCYGITLISLVITIIIMLILVAVTLSITLGENGLIAKAKEAKEVQLIAQEKELISVALNNWQIEKNTQKEKTFAEFMIEELKSQADVIDSIEYLLIDFKESKNCFKVTENGQIEILLQGIEEQKIYAKFIKGYQEVEYLQNTENQWIDTEIPINTLVNPIIETEFKFSGGDTDKFGTNTVSSNTILWNMSGATTYLRYGTSNSRAITYENGFSSNNLNFTDFHKLRIGDGVTPITGQVPIYVDEILIGKFNANDKASFSSSEHLLLYRGRNNSQVTFKNFKITDNGIVILNLVPCIEKVEEETKEIKITLENDMQNCKQAKEFFNQKLSEINEINRYSGKLTNQNQKSEKYNLIDVNVSYGISTSATRYGAMNPSWGSENYDLKNYSGDTFSGILLKNPLRGMYDLANGKFYTNQGTADFSAGELVK